MQGGQGQARVSPEGKQGLPFARLAPAGSTQGYLPQELSARGQLRIHLFCPATGHQCPLLQPHGQFPPQPSGPCPDAGRLSCPAPMDSLCPQLLSVLWAWHVLASLGLHALARQAIPALAETSGSSLVPLAHRPWDVSISMGVAGNTQGREHLPKDRPRAQGQEES